MAYTNYSRTIFVTVDAVKDSLGIGQYDTVDEKWLRMVVDAVNEFISHLRADLTWMSLGQFDPDQFVWSEYDTAYGMEVLPHLMTNPRLRLGAVMLAGRWYKRRGAEDIAAYTEFGGPPPTIDKDIEVLLEVNRMFRPVVA